MSIPDKKEKGKTINKEKIWRPQDVLKPDKANWDESNTVLFINFVINEFNNKNRSGQYLDARGYNNVIKSFYDLTGKYYDKQQLKNKYNVFRRDWIAWNQLKGQSSTGLGWDPEKKTYTAPEHWWDKMIAMNENCLKFKKGGLEHEELLDQIFCKTSATGKTQWTPGEELQSEENEIDENTESLDGVDFTNEKFYENNHSQFEINQEDNEIGNGSGKRKASKGSTTHTDKKKKGTSGPSRRLSSSGIFQQSISSLIDVIQNQGNEVVVKQYSETVEDKISKSIEKLNELRGVIGNKLYIDATKLMLKAAEREVFMKLPDDDTRILWLQSFEKKESSEE